MLGDLGPETLEQLEGHPAHKMRVGAAQQFGIIDVEDSLRMTILFHSVFF